MFNRIPRIYDRTNRTPFERTPRDPDAYENAIQRRIKENARIGRGRRWLAEDPTRDALIKALYNARGSFAGKMIEAYNEWGSLTAGQERAVRNIVERNAQRDQERQQARAKEAATSQHIGTEGVRQDFVLTIRVVLEFETQFGTMHVHIMHDAAGNVVVYKGSAELGEKGETVTVKATVKKHDVREGVRQTVINRPKVLTVATPAPAPEDAPAAPVAPAIATPEPEVNPARGSLAALVAQVEQAKPVVEGPHCHRCGRATEQHVPYCDACLK